MRRFLRDALSAHYADNSRQQQRGYGAAWTGMAGFPAEAWRQSAAPAWADQTGGDASWVVEEADVKVLHWVWCIRFI